MKTNFFRIMPVVVLLLSACAPIDRAPATSTSAQTSGGAQVPIEQVRDDLPSPATRSDAEVSRQWEGLGSTGGGTGTGVSIGTTAEEPQRNQDSAGPQR